MSSSSRQQNHLLFAHWDIAENTQTSLSFLNEYYVQTPAILDLLSSGTTQASAIYQTKMGEAKNKAKITLIYANKHDL